MKKNIFIILLITSVSFSQNKTIEQRIDSVLALMTLDEKVGQLVQYSGGWDTGTQTSKPKEGHIELIRKGKIGSLLNVFGAEETKKIQKVAVEEARLKIPIIFGLDVIHGFRATFPIPLAEASSWNPALVEFSARSQAVEASSSGIHWTFNPMIDIARDPRWGRIMEGSGEDPYLGSLMATARVKGYQGNEHSPSFTKIIACAKHFAGYGGAEGGRDYNTVDISERTFRDIYLRPFKAAVDAGIGSFMASFNEIGGIPSSGNKFLLTDILRGEWKFDGFVVSDWNSIGELIPHGVAKDLKQAAELGINAGVDMDMEANAYYNHLAELVKEEKVNHKVLDESVRRVLRIKFRLGLFDDPYRYCNVEREKLTLMNDQLVKAAFQVALESIVLLKNKDNVLPIKKDLKKIAVIGPLANSTDDPLGGWSQQGNAKDVISVLHGIKNKVGKNVEVSFEAGCSAIGFEKNNFDKAISLAKASDVTIVVVGESRNMIGEAASRARLDLPGVQEDLVKQLKNTGKPVVVILMNGRPLTIPWIYDNVSVIIESWYLGIQTGNAVADVLFGDYNPNGKLPVTFPRYVGQVPIYYNHKNTGRPYNPNDHYTSYYQDLENTPLFPFGYGLSYSTFEYSDLSISKKEMKKDESIKVSVNVKNTSTVDGMEVVQLYIQDLVGSVTRPVKELKDFSKIFLKAGEEKQVEFIITPDKLKFYNLNMNFEVEPGEFKIFVGTNSVDLKETSFFVIE
jgi:beta-glucosidase